MMKTTQILFIKGEWYKGYNGANLGTNSNFKFQIHFQFLVVTWIVYVKQWELMYCLTYVLISINHNASCNG